MGHWCRDRKAIFCVINSLRSGKRLVRPQSRQSISGLYIGLELTAGTIKQNSRGVHGILGGWRKDKHIVAGIDEALLQEMKLR